MSKNSELFRNEWISVYQSEKGFTYCQRKSVDSIAALLYRMINGKYEFLIHYQPLPEIKQKKYWDQPYACPITGSIEDNQSPIDCCINEVKEEAGFYINRLNIKKIIKNIATTQMNEQVFNLLVDVTNLEQFPPKTDGSIFEAVAFNKWVDQEEFESILLNEYTLSSLHTLYLWFLKSIS
ncbi:hypothetical protein MCAL160_0162 [Mycoplasmopsis californica HAZ160_1]|uniref:Uncharacterized protein n=2 Tax=Mycoplasmopsis californica TaxID=2113 RepID=A0A059XMF9_9BACT|nr:NUDIX hydrolase [Mycoplasmopsis californica]AIA29699.1 hypothetical protein MCFN_02910 [Mycoplasmopsis californica]BAP00871.1 hypothetical protein MCAL160_0162 [Mycoplasmopsis californica HAZ160_1]BBG40728.1 hypothetical protein MCAL106_0162 [Mycoplasmopsis californica]BBG41322.1 hypothetical protein MCAL106E_0162 [Mycoplasmopsis californica]BBG41915.1 hypothetical protein MCAL106L_0162 [Mycoplasmopsis californica]